jgi:methionyl-tRNA formyltransferase
MGDTPVRDPAGWRLVVFTTLPGGKARAFVDEIVRPLGHRIVGVVAAAEPQRRRRAAALAVVTAVRPGVDLIVSTHPERWAAMLRPLRPDLLISAGFPRRIPDDVLALPRLGAINFHDAPLPRHRGPNATGWAFRLGDPETALTIHRLTSEFDAGPILAQAPVPITDDDDVVSLTAKLRAQAPALLRQTLARVAPGDPGEPQDPSQATDAGLFEEAWRSIDWSQPARTVHNQVRSWIGLRGLPPGALGQIDGQTLRITKTRLLPTAAEQPAPPRRGGAAGRRATRRAMWRWPDRAAGLATRVIEPT